MSPRRVATGTMLALALITSTAAAAAQHALTGTTGQRRHVRLGVPRAGRRWFTYRATLTCSDGSTFTDDRFSDLVKPNARGRFHAVVRSRRGAIRTTVKGVTKHGRAHGTLRIIERYELPDSNGITPLNPDGPVICSSGTVAWKAH